MEGEVREGEGQKNEFSKKQSSVVYTFNMHRTNTRENGHFWSLLELHTTPCRQQLHIKGNQKVVTHMDLYRSVLHVGMRKMAQRQLPGMLGIPP